MTREEMKPCPFCGSQPELMEGHRNHWRVECPRCGVKRAQFANGGVEEDKARAIRSWNRRTPAAALLTQCAEALEWIRKSADTNLEQDDKLRTRGARTLARIAGKAEALLIQLRGDTDHG